MAGAASGALLALATAPAPVGWTALLALAPFLRASVRARRARAGALAGFACGTAFFGAGFLWVPWNVGAPVLWVLYLVGVPLLALPLAGVGALLAWLGRAVGTGAALAAAPGLWVAVESLRAGGAFGIPWLRLGYALADWPLLLQTASLGGVSLVSAWIVAVNAALVLALEKGGAVARFGPLGAVLAVVPIAASMAGAPAAGASASLRVAAVQPRIPASERFDPAAFDANLGRLLDLSERALAGRPDLIAWPESAFERPAGAEGSAFLGAIAHQLDTPVLAGVRRPATADGRLRWNSVALATPDGGSRLVGDKVRPLPLYERAPESALQRELARVAWWPGRVLAAREPGLVEVASAGGAPVRIGILVCIDSAHPELARALRRRGAQALVSVANEAESGAWSARQHAALVRLRAVETGLPVARVANTGPSVWIDARGRELARLDAETPAVGLAPIGSPAAPPPYVALGDAPVMGLLLLPGAATIGRALLRTIPTISRATASRRRREGGTTHA
jgi:apolipoprotein N-acyltransferase